MVVRNTSWQWSSTVPSKRMPIPPQSNNASISSMDRVSLGNQALSGFQDPVVERRHRRKLTMHVVTRWYRPPEVILLHHHYDSSLDMWSVGCIMGDLLSMMKSNVSDSNRRGPLFPGDSCYPLTGDGYNTQDKDNSVYFDQLDVIFSILGTPTVDDLRHITDPKARQYIRTLPFHTRQNLGTLYPGTSVVGMDLMSRLLQFNPRKRLTAEQAIMHPFFNTIRPPTEEIVSINSEYYVTKLVTGAIHSKISPHNI